MSRTPGVFQRCRPDCPPRCRTHKWAFTVEVGVDANERRRQVTKGGFATQRDAKIARDQVLAQYRAGTLAEDPRQTVGQYLDAWLARKIEAEAIRPTTVRAYRQHVDTYLKPHVGHLRLSDLRPAHIARMYAAIKKEGAAGRPLSPASIRRVHATLRSALRDAVRRGEMTADPTTRVVLPSSHRPKVQPWEPAQFGQFLDAIDGHRLAPLYLLAGTAGLRRGELAGLRWADVDLDAGRLVVHQQVVPVGHTLHVGPPKTVGAEARVVDLDSGTVEALRAWRARQAAERLAWGPAYTDSGLVFTQEDGRGWHPEYVTKAFPAWRRRPDSNLAASTTSATSLPASCSPPEHPCRSCRSASGTARCRSRQTPTSICSRGSAVRRQSGPPRSSRARTRPLPSISQALAPRTDSRTAATGRCRRSAPSPRRDSNARPAD